MNGSETPIKLWTKTYSPEEREFLAKAILECIRRKYPLNLLEIGIVAREMLINSAHNSPKSNAPQTPAQSVWRSKRINIKDFRKIIYELSQKTKSILSWKTRNNK